MPAVAFDVLPRDARVWVFAADVPVAGDHARELLESVDAFLRTWNAHGNPLTCARAWRDDRFLAIGVDQSTAGASGCSIDGLFRTLQQLAPHIGASLLPGGKVFWRDAGGEIQAADRRTFAGLGATGAVTRSTKVFDTSVTTAEGWRERFELEADMSWHTSLLG